MASRYRSMNSSASSGEPHFHTDQGPVPIAVVQCRDFAVRCDLSPYLWKPPNRLPPGYSINQMIDQRVNYGEHRTKVNSNLDVAFVRFSREAEYAERLSVLVSDPGSLEEMNWFDAHLLLAERSLIMKDGAPDEREREAYMPLAWRRWERTGRNRYGVFVAVQHREVMGMRPGVARGKYPVLPDEWYRYELPYGLNAQAPPLLTYYGLELAWNSPSSGHWSLFWKVLYTEHAWTAVAELLHEARRGTLWWIPQDLILGIEAIGLLAICYNDSAHAEELEGLLYEIRVIRWDRVPRQFGPVPRVNFHRTPVYNSGDCVDFDPIDWCTHLKGEMYVAMDAEGTPLEGMVDRGQIQEVELRHEVENPVAYRNIYLDLSDDFGDSNEHSALPQEPATPMARCHERDAQLPSGSRDERVEELDIRDVGLSAVQPAQRQSAVRTSIQPCGLPAIAASSSERPTAEVCMVQGISIPATVATESSDKSAARPENASRQQHKPLLRVKAEAEVIDVDALFASSPENEA